jgi:hypothetical protein
LATHGDEPTFDWETSLLAGHSHSLYKDRIVALLTQHGKERVIAPVLEAALGCEVVRVTGYDTDRLGTFTREIPRAGTQLEAARKKARIGMELSGMRLGVASEGAFGPDPMVGLMPWDLELIVFIDDEIGLELVGTAQGQAVFGHRLVADWGSAESFARQSGFPEHFLVIRPESENDPRIRKGISSWEELEEVFGWALEQSGNGMVCLETDVRAHANPTRMRMIAQAAEDLAQKLTSCCPECGVPGFGPVERVAGLRCEGCGLPTRETAAEILGCPKCTHRVTRTRDDRLAADPQFCDYCNP